jgi:hypothetical protein
MASDAWAVLPHGPIEEVSENLWRVQGTLANVPLQRVMTIAKLADGRLVVHSAIALEEDAMKRIEAWGDPAVLVVPSGYHRLDAARFARRYPAMRVYCPRGARARVEKVVAVHGTCEDVPKDARVRFEPVAGIGDKEGVMRVTSSDGETLVLNDILFNMPHATGMGGLFTRFIGSSGGPRVTRTARFFLLEDARALRARFEELASTPSLRRIIVAHHETITDDPAGTLRRVATTL